MRTLIHVAAVVILFTGQAVFAAELTILTENLPPLNYVENGVLVGPSVEIVQEIQILYARELPAISLYYPDTLAAYRPETGVDWFYTPGGISKGIPIPQNKMVLIP